MTRDDIIRMAKEAGYLAWHIDPRAERFAALVAAAEREACAAMVESLDVQHPKYIADAIRKRGDA
jgi:hypothetical protein